jgi:hypothetical protein
VFQYDTNTGLSSMLVDVNNEGYGVWDGTVKLNLANNRLGNNVYQQDIVEFWGTVQGSDTYTTEIGGTNTVPVIEVQYMTLVSSPPS